MITLGLLGGLLLLLIWLGYPAAIRLLGGLPRHTASDSLASLPSVSVVLASRDDTEAINARVRDLRQADYPADRLEIIVALDHARSPGQVQLSGSDLMRLVEGDAPGGKAATLNAGVREAKHEILVFTDTAQRFDRDAIGVLARELRMDVRLGAVSGMLDLPGAGGSLNLAERYWRYERWLRRWEARVHSAVGVTGAIYAMRRELWKPLPANLILDDVYVPMRLALEGWRVGFTERARAYDVRRFAPSQEYRRKVRTLTGVIQVCAWLPGVLNPGRNPIWLQFVFHKLLRLLTPYLVLLVALGVMWATVAALLSSRFGVPVLLVAGLVGAALLTLPAVRRKAGEQLAWGVALQSSAVVATVNGLRGRWDVWR